MKPALRALFELLRLPNLFTVPGDILVGWFCVSQSGGIPWWGIVASLCLYSAGLLFNDFFDAQVDAAERPSRPIPSGRISRRTVGILATVLMLLGIAFSGKAWPMAVVLALLILAYDGGLKKIPFVGILTMGCCRGANILLGAACTGALTLSTPLAGCAGFFTGYIILVSLLARGEVRYPHRPQVIGLLIRLLIPLQCAALFLCVIPPQAIMIVLLFLVLSVGAELTGRVIAGS